MQPEVDFLPAVLEIQEKPPSPLGRVIAIAIAAFFAVALIWSYIGEIEIVAVAQGKIIPAGRVKTIQPLELGIVRSIHVQEGQIVSAGDLLIELDSTQTRADLGQIEEEIAAGGLDIARIRKLLRMVGISGDPVDLQNNPVPSYVDEIAEEFDETNGLQRSLLRSQWEEYQARHAALDGAVASRQADLAATREQVKKYRSTLPLIARRADALRQMVDRKLGPEVAWLELEEQRLAQKQDLAALLNRQVQLIASIEESVQQRAALAAQFRRELLNQLTEIQRRIDQLRQQRIKAQQRTQQQQLIAPVDGAVQQLAIHTLGGVVTPAQELLKVVPRNPSLEIEAWILNKDIGFIERDQPAEIKIESFPFTRFGTLTGKIIDISGDAVADEERGLVYAGRVGLEQSAIRVGKRRIHLTPGMAVTVEVETGKRRLLDYILSPLLRYKDESLRER